MKQTTAIKSVLLALVCMLTGIFAQAQVPTYEMYITNQSQVSSKIYQFDVYVLRTGATELEMASMQFGLGYDTSITNGGTITFSFVAGSSQLVAAQVPISFQSGTVVNTVNGVAYRYLNQAARSGPGAGNGTVISATKTSCSSPGTRIGTYRVTNTVDFRQASSTKHIFNVTAASGRTATAVSAYVGGVNTVCTGTLLAYNSANTCDQNLSLNGCAVTAVATPSAATCFGVANGSASVSLSGVGTSATGTYSVDGGASVAYSSNPFTVSGLSAGTHVITVTSGTCPASTGSFTVGGPSGAAVSTTTASACGSFTWNGNTYTSSGTYTANLITAAGCDSTATLNLTIRNTSSSSTSITACNSYTWNGNTYTTSGVRTFTTTNAAGCDSIATLNLTIRTSTTSTTNQSACGSFTWNGTTYTTSGVRTFTTTNAAGCDSVATLNLTITSASSSTSNVTVCTSALPYSWNGQSLNAAGTYTANLTNAAGCDSTATLNLTVNTGSTRSINLSVCNSALPFSWNGVSITGAGTYTATLTNSVGCDSVVTATVTTTSATPAAPTAITQTLISNVCGARQYRFSTAAVTNAAGYNWLVPTSVGGVSGMTVDSGDVNSSRIIVVTFASNAASLTTDSVRVRAFSGCGNSAYRAARLNNTALNAPAAPSAITITAVQANVCGNKIYRYSAPVLPGATTTATAATGWLWSFEGTLGANASIDSGTVNSRTILVSYTSNAAGVAGDSVRVRFTSFCGNGASKAARLTNTVIAVPAAPASVTITAIQTNVCGVRRYRYSAPNLPAGTATAAAATGYVWDFVGSLAEFATIDSGSLTSQRFTVTYSSNEASTNADSIRVYYTSSCGNSARARAKLSNTKLNPPAAPTAITITALQTNVCGARRYRYSAPVLPAATTTAGAATGYIWDFVGSLQSTVTVDSGSLTSRTFTVTFTSNAAATTDSVRVLYTSDCGNSARARAKLTNTLLSAPAAPATITIALKEDVCNARKYRYIGPSPLPGATTTAGAATGYLWSMPTGTVGSTGTLDSGSLTDRIIVISYTSNAAAGTDSIRLRYTSGCGNGAIKAQKLSNTLKTGCPPPPITKAPVTQAPAGSMSVKVYPNPTTSQFNVQVNTTGSEEAVVRILDVQGRFVKSVKVAANQVISLGAELKAGAYLLEVRQGNEVKTTRVIKF